MVKKPVCSLSSGSCRCAQAMVPVLKSYICTIRCSLPSCQPGEYLDKTGKDLHYGVRWGCAPVLGSFWPENSGIEIYFYWKIYGSGVYCYTLNSGFGC